MEAMATDIRAGVEACRRECDYFSLCGGGAPVNKLSENGTFASTQTSFCNLVQYNTCESHPACVSHQIEERLASSNLQPPQHHACYTDLCITPNLKDEGSPHDHYQPNSPQSCPSP